MRRLFLSPIPGISLGAKVKEKKRKLEIEKKWLRALNG
jgi:hypothetical protein